MAGQSMEFTITGKDQSSQVLETVQRKLQHFGTEVGRSIVHVVGPMALLDRGIGFIGDKLAEMQQKAKEAFDWGSSLSDAAAKLNVTVEQFQRIQNAAEETGQSTDKVAQAFKLAGDLIQQAKAGSADAAESIKAMGLNMDNLDKMKPEDILRALASALNSTTDPAQRAQMAIAALGKSAKDLQDTLAKGFDIAGALENTEGLTAEEANFLKQQAREEAKIKNKERLAEARRTATQRFLEQDPQGKQMLAEGLKGARGGIFTSLGTLIMPGMIGAVAGQVANVETLGRDEATQRKVQAILAERERARQAAAAAMNPPNPAAGDALRRKYEADAKREEGKDKTKEVKGSKIGGASNDSMGSLSIKDHPFTVSSLREIGGGIAGERVTSTVDLLQVQLEIQKSMLKELEMINTRTRDPVDFTKPKNTGGVNISAGLMSA